MNKVDLDELKTLSLDDLLDKYSLEELESLLTLKVLLGKFPDVTEDPASERSGVLLRDEIEKYVENFKLIHPFNRNNLKGASCYLTVGTEYALGGKRGKLNDEPGRNELKIPPFEVAIIRTGEIINMPRFLIARWNIRVTEAYEGLLWVGGPQVDPGWIGYLFCPIYNLSDQEYVLKKGDSLAVVDFTKTTAWNKNLEGKGIQRPPRRISIKDYNWKLRSALFTEAAQKIDKVENKVKRLESLAGVMMMILAICVAVIAIFVTSTQDASSVAFSWLLYVSVSLSLIALAISLFMGVESWRRQRRRK